MNFKRFAYILPAIAGLLGAVSCADSGEAPVVPPDDTMVNLSFAVVAPPSADPPQSRANVVVTPDPDNYFEREATKYERIHTLRIIILRPDGTVEHNKLFILGDDGKVYCDNMTFKVESGERKRIYILGNEAAVPFDFSTVRGTYTAGTIENITLSAGAGNVLIDNSDKSSAKWYLPMSEVHDVYVKTPQNKEEYNQTIGPLFITRAAVKFTFNFSSEYGEGLYVTDLTFNQLADREYYLPNNTTYFPPKTAPAQVNWTGAPDPELKGRFITNYSIPADAEHSPQTFTIDGGLAFGTKDKPTVFTPALYFCESMYRPTTTEPYTLTMTVAEKITDTSGVESFGNKYTFGPVELPNLPILPRNTHVVVNAHLTDTDIECTVRLVPYTGVWLDPIFGIDRN